jgi:hypothetical protein
VVLGIESYPIVHDIELHTLWSAGESYLRGTRATWRAMFASARAGH